MTVHPGPEAPGEISDGAPQSLLATPPIEDRVPLPPGDVGPRKGSTGPRRALAAILVCAVLGGLAGLVLSLTGKQMPSAVTMLTFVPDPAIPGQQGNAQEVTDRFIQTQILLLTGADVRDGVAESLDLGSPLMLSARQVGATDVVRLEVEATTGKAATTASTAVIQQYDERRRTAFASQVGALLGRLDEQLAQLESQLQPGDEGALTGSQTTEYSRLLAERNQLALLSAGSASYTEVVDQPRVETQSSVAVVLKAMAVGMLIGAVLGAGMALLLQRFRLV